MGSYHYVILVDQLQGQVGVEFYSQWYYTQSGMGLLARKIMVALNLHLESMLLVDGALSNVILSCFILLNFVPHPMFRFMCLWSICFLNVKSPMYPYLFCITSCQFFANESVHRRPGDVKPATNLLQSVVPCKANTEKDIFADFSKNKAF